MNVAAQQMVDDGRNGYQIHHVTGQERLSEQQQSWLKRSLITAFPDLKMREYFAAKSGWFDEYDHLLYCVEDSSGDVVGLLAARWVTMEVQAGSPATRLLHATTQFIAPHWQGTNMLRNIWRVFLGLTTFGAHGFPELIVLKTCHPRAFRPMLTFARVPGIDVYPNIDGSPQEHKRSALAQQIANRICPDHEFDASTGVIRDISTPPDFYPRLPEGKPGSLANYYFQTHLTCRDRLLCVTHIRTERARSIVLNAFAVKTE